MKGFFHDAAPRPDDLLLLESGSPAIFHRALENIRQTFPCARLHLLTCWTDPPPGPFASIRHVRDYDSRRDKLRLLFSFRRNPPAVLGLLCSREPVMYSWKLLALLLVPAKVLIINENGDFFWLDWHHRRTLRQFLQSRWVVIRKEFLLTLLRTALFPFLLVFLLGSALRMYLRRWRRLLGWKLRRRGPVDQVW